MPQTEISEKERIILRSDTKFLCNYENTIYKKVFTDLLEAYKKVFLIIYHCYHLRFINFFHKNLHYYFTTFFYNELIEKFTNKFLLDELNGTKEDDFYILCFEYAIKQNADLQRLVRQNKKGSKSKEIRKIFEQKYLSKYLNKIEFVFFYDENINQDFKTDELKYPLNIKVIYDDLYRVVFKSIDYWMNLVEFDKMVMRKRNKYIDKQMKFYFNLINDNKDKIKLDYVPNPLTTLKEDLELLYQLFNSKDLKVLNAAREAFDIDKEVKGLIYESMAERKATQRIRENFQSYFMNKIDFEKELIEQLKQLTNLKG